MSKETEKPKSTGGRREQPVKTFRSGAVAASVWKRQTPTGFEYLDFSLSRSWKLKSGAREGYSSNFFERNQQALYEVVGEACAYIRSHQVVAPDGDLRAVALQGTSSALAS